MTDKTNGAQEPADISGEKAPEAPKLCPGSRLLADFWGTLGAWEEGRLLWLLGGLSALAMELFSYFYYQLYLGLKPCEYCVLIRLAMWGIALGGFWGAACPRSMLLRFPGYLISTASAVWGLKLTFELEFINLASESPDYYPLCGSGGAPFPFGLPLDRLLPSHFYASGACGVDSLWSFMDFTMTQLLLMVYPVYIIGLLFMFISWILRRRSRKP